VEFVLETDVVCAPVGEGSVLLDQRRGCYFQLNATGTLIVRSLAEGATVAEMAAALRERYGIVAERAESDVAALVEALRARGLVRS
jgi:PqqD family protein of HPr-rel-A system